MMTSSLKYQFTIFLVFITALSSWSQVPLNWIVDEVNPGEDVTLFPEETLFTDGTKSCHLQLNSGDVPYLISDMFYVTPGAEYEFSIDIFDNDTAGQVKVYADFYDTYGFNIFGEPPVFSADSGEWQAISWQGTVPAQAVVGYILIKYYCQPNLYGFTRKADAWIDNIRFQTVGGENLVVNGSFENWMVGIGDSGPKAVDMIVYPNPARDYFNVILPSECEKIIVSDLLGREKFRIQGSGANQCRVDLTSLSSGTFFLTAYFHDGIRISKIVNRISDH